MSEWIETAKQLPEAGVPVLAVAELASDEVQTGMAYILQGSFVSPWWVFTNAYGSRQPNAEITHWLPIPPTPNQETAE
jgi:hypothetical protein